MNTFFRKTYTRARGEVIRFERIGVRDASTFPGFCTVHEAEFGVLETAKDLASDRDWVLQFFRTVCWEVRFLDHARRQWERFATTYDERLRQRAEESINARVGEPVRVAHVKGVDRRQDRAEQEIEWFKTTVRSYERDFLSPLREVLAGGDPDLGMNVITIEETIPVCLAGRGNFHCTSPSGPLDVPVFLQVFPTATTTRIGLLASATGAPAVETYIDSFVRRPFGPLHMVESWMLHGTDHWYLRPSVWDALSPDRKALAEGEFVDKSLSIGEINRATIFDAIRAVSGRVDVRLP